MRTLTRMARSVAESNAHRTRWILIGSFSAIALLFAAINLAAMFWSRQIREEIGKIVKKMLTSVELVARIEHDIDEEQILVDTYYLESSPIQLDHVEVQLAAVREDFAAAERAYDPLPTQPTEAVAWDGLKRDLQSIQPQVGEVLRLSRQRRLDGEKHGALLALTRRFATVEREAAALMEINRESADRAMATAKSLQRSTSRLLGVLPLIGVVLTLGVGAWATRLVQRREILLEVQNRELDAFSGRVAHDLRGPLGNISLGASHLSVDQAPSATTINTIRRGVDRTRALIEDLLALSRLSVRTPSSVCDPSTVATQVAEELAPRLEQESGALLVATESALVRSVDGLLRQALANLIDNALKYRRAGVSPRVELNGRSVDGLYELRIADNGIGMSPNETRQVFQPFFRAFRLRGASGTGLGLSIVKRIVEASGGTVRVQSILGQGTTFVIVLPLAESVRV